MGVDFLIHSIISNQDIKVSARVVRDSFRTVAEEFHLTRENCKTHPSFTTIQKLREMKKKGLIFFGGFLDGKQVGFVAVEDADGTLSYMERLAVLPAYRHQGYGTLLVNHVKNYVEHRGGKKISIGIIDDSVILKNWYQHLGFKEISTRKFSHLPFTVCFMELTVSK